MTFTEHRVIERAMILEGEGMFHLAHQALAFWASELAKYPDEKDLMDRVLSAWSSIGNFSCWLVATQEKRDKAMTTVARPNKLFDASALEDWAQDRYPDLWEEWEREAATWIGFWEFMEQEYDEELGEFERWWREQQGGL